MIPDHVQQYVCSLIKPRNSVLTEMELYASTNEIPIMDLVSMEAMLQILSFIQPKNILEIGTAIGYSAMRMAERFPHSKIVSIERDQNRYEKAVQFIREAKLDKQIKVIFGDALLEAKQIEQYGPFDALFIDAAKGQYKRFFERYSPLVQKNGLVISDNILFKGIVADEGKLAKGLRTMVTNLRQFNHMLAENEQFETTFYPIGDGLAISKKL